MQSGEFPPLRELLADERERTNLVAFASETYAQGDVLFLCAVHDFRAASSPAVAADLAQGIFRGPWHPDALFLCRGSRGPRRVPGRRGAARRGRGERDQPRRGKGAEKGPQNRPGPVRRGGQGGGARAAGESCELRVGEEGRCRAVEQRRRGVPRVLCCGDPSLVLAGPIAVTPVFDVHSHIHTLLCDQSLLEYCTI
jgi:hypothetical protein